MPDSLRPPWTEAHQAPVSMRFSRQAYWSGLAISSSRGSSQPRDRTRVSCTAGRFFTDWATRETQANYDLQQFVKKYTFMNKNQFIFPLTWSLQDSETLKLQLSIPQNYASWSRVTISTSDKSPQQLMDSLCACCCVATQKDYQTFKLKTKNIFQISTACTHSIWRGFQLDI